MAWKQFAQLPIEAISDERIRGNKLLVLCTILSFCDKHGVSRGWTRKDMAGRCGLPETRFSSVTSELEAIGWLKKIGSGGRSMPCEYQVIIPKTVTDSVTLYSTQPTEETVTQTVTVTDFVTVTKNDTVKPTETVTDFDVNGYTFGTETVTDSVTRTNKTEKAHKKHITKTKEKFIPPEWIPVEIWEDWEAHRKSMKAPLSDKARNLGVSSLQKLVAEGNDPIEVINRSIENGWKGFFALPTQQQKQPRNGHGGSYHDRRAATARAILTPSDEYGSLPDSGETYDGTATRIVD
jgi:hypothetical protein